MGKCYSCCKAPELPGASSSSSSSTRYAGSHHSTAKVDRNHQQLCQPLQEKEIKVVPINTEVTAITTGRQTITTEKKTMFTPYSKLPPIKKQSNGDSKRLSFVSKDFSENKAHAMFENYKEPDEDMMLAEGIEKFCDDLEVRPEEYIVLVLAWKFNAETMCKFTREQFVSGCKALRVDNIRGIQSKFSEMLTETQNKQSFKDLYRWTYKFGLDVETNQRTLPIDMAMSLWKLVFSQLEPTVLPRWLNFLQKHQNIRGVSRDTWDMFLNFTEQVGEDLSSYDDTEAWPSLLDDFVEYENDCQNQNVEMD